MLKLKLKLQYFGHLMREADSLEKTRMLGKIEARGEEDNRRQDSWMASPAQWTWVWARSRKVWRIEKPGVLQSMGLQSRIWLSNWITICIYMPSMCFSILRAHFILLLNNTLLYTYMFHFWYWNFFLFSLFLWLARQQIYQYICQIISIKFFLWFSISLISANIFLFFQLTLS